MEKVNIGDVVVFVDQYGQEHDALVTEVHGHYTKEERDAYYRSTQAANAEAHPEWANEEWLNNALNMPFVLPSLNVVYVSNNESQMDSYGRQTARATSAPYQSMQAAHGYYWRNK